MIQFKGGVLHQSRYDLTIFVVVIARAKLVVRRTQSRIVAVSILKAQILFCEWLKPASPSAADCLPYKELNVIVAVLLYPHDIVLVTCSVLARHTPFAFNPFKLPAESFLPPVHFQLKGNILTLKILGAGFY
jgi:hypothetical protein